MNIERVLDVSFCLFVAVGFLALDVWIAVATLRLLGVNI